MSLPYFYTLLTLLYVKEWVLYRCQEEIDMKKKLSVIISVICIIVSLGSISGTLYYAKNHNTSSMMQQAEGTPPSMPNQGENSQNNESNQQDSSQNNKSSNDQSNSQNQDSNDQTNENSNGQAPNNQQGAPGQSNSQPTMPGQNNKTTINLVK